MSETVNRAQDGSVRITSQLGPTLTQRAGYEKQLLSAKSAGVEIVDGQKWERMHSQGPITGHESSHGIVYAPFEVNRTYQQHGIEEELRQMQRQKAADVEFELETVTECHPGTRRLSRIQYKVTAIRNGVRTLVFERALKVGNEKKSPTVTGEGRGLLNLEPFLSPVSQRPPRVRIRSRANVRGAVSAGFSTMLTASFAMAGLSMLAGKLREQLEDRMIKRQMDSVEEEMNKQIAARKGERAEIQSQGATPTSNVTVEIVVSRFTDISHGLPITDQAFPVVTLEDLQVSKFPAAPNEAIITKFMTPGGVVRNYFVRAVFSIGVSVTGDELSEYQQIQREVARLTELLGDSNLPPDDRERIKADYVRSQQQYAEWQKD